MPNFQILIVSAVKIRKQCLQTALAFFWGGGFVPPDPLPGLRLWTPLRNFRPPDLLGYSPSLPNENFWCRHSLHRGVYL